MFENSVTLEGQRQINFAVSNVAAQSVPLDPGIYDVWCDTDVIVKVGQTADDVTTDNGYLIKLGTTIPVRVIGMNNRIGAIAVGTGTIRFHKVSQ